MIDAPSTGASVEKGGGCFLFTGNFVMLLFFSSVSNFFRGALIGRRWPLSGAWAIGIRIILAGLTMILTGSAIRGIGSQWETAENTAKLEAPGDVIDMESEEIQKD